MTAQPPITNRARFDVEHMARQLEVIIAHCNQVARKPEPEDEEHDRAEEEGDNAFRQAEADCVAGVD